MSLLFDDQPLVVSPAAAARYGLNEAIVLQQLHYWMLKSTNEHDGHVWVYNTTGEWRRQFPFWSESTIKRTLAALRERGLIVVSTSPHNAMDRTNWYRLDYDALRALDDASGQSELMAGSDCADGEGQSAPVSNRTETTTETTTKRRAPRAAPPSEHPWPTTVDRKRVTDVEGDFARRVLDGWNEAAGQSLRAKSYLSKIIMRMREHPELSVIDHVGVIRSVLSGRRWWSGEPDPRIVYGSDGQFESCLAALRARSNGGAPPLSGVQSGRTDVQTHEPEVRGDLDSRIRY